MDSNTMQKRCWNCRQRKRACDRKFPSCQNCLDKGQQCLGYGLKLSWPRDNDEKRSSLGSNHFILPVTAGAADFINTSSNDVDMTSPVCSREQMSVIYRAIGHLSSSIEMLDPFLARNGFSPVARLLSSSSDAGGIYGLLVRLSLHDDTMPSLAVRHAITAISQQHLRKQDVALVHQTTAIRSLQTAINEFDRKRVMQTTAASLLLSMFESLNFMWSSGPKCAIYFRGAKSIVTATIRPHATLHGDQAMLIDWLFYLDVMCKFSLKYWKNKDDEQVKFASQVKITSKPAFSAERQTIVPTLGCSQELLDLLCLAIDAAPDSDDSRHHVPPHIDQLESIERRLHTLDQRYTGDHGQDPEESTHRVDIAELFRLALLIYLARAAQGVKRDDPTVKERFAAALAVLRRLDYCDRPWPMLIVALEARDEDDRAAVSAVLRKTVERMPFGSMPHCRVLIFDAWKYSDLHWDRDDAQELYELVINKSPVPPCFA